jgi:hypothetical protein
MLLQNLKLLFPGWYKEFASRGVELFEDHLADSASRYRLRASTPPKAPTSDVTLAPHADVLGPTVEKHSVST